MSVFTPTTKRGAELAQEVLDQIIATEKFDEERRKQSPGDQAFWDQGSWAIVIPSDFPAGTNVEAIPDSVKMPRGSYYDKEELVIVDAGPSCGTAFCFAGWACALAGDRQVMRVPERAARYLRTGVASKNLRRWVNKFKNGWTNTQSSTDMVLTVDSRVMAIKQRARELLQIDENFANELFAPFNDLEALKRGVSQMRR